MKNRIPEGERRRNVHEWELDLYCPVPSATDGTDYAFNTDVMEMSERDRQAEREKVRLRLLVDPSPHPWLIQRLAALEAASNVEG